MSMTTFAPTIYQRAVLVLSGVIAVYIAQAGLLQPDAFMASMQIAIEGDGGRNEIRGQYGGFFLVVAALLIAGAVGLVRTTSALLLLASLYGGVLLGRLASLAIDGTDVFADYPGVLQRAHWLDASGLVLTLFALLEGDRPRSAD